MRLSISAALRLHRPVIANESPQLGGSGLAAAEVIVGFYHRCLRSVAKSSLSRRTWCKSAWSWMLGDSLGGNGDRFHPTLMSGYGDLYSVLFAADSPYLVAHFMRMPC